MDELLKQVPVKLRDRYREIVALTDQFCDEHLDEEYKQLCREMAAAVCQEGSPVTKGKDVGWAAGVVGAVAWVNFLSDPSQPHHMRTDDMARALGVSPATLAAKVKVIRNGLDLQRMDPAWTVPSRLEDNPLAWLVQDQNGLIHDLRQAPREVQAEAYRRGLIPFIPGERPEENDAEDRP
jgi:hypothetical protein